MESTNSYEFADQFLSQIIDELVDYKNKNTDFEKKLLSSLGATFNKSEIDQLKSKDSIFLKQEILKKFSNKRDERSSILGEIQEKKLRKEFFFN